MAKEDRLEDKCRVFSYGLDIKKEFLAEDDNVNKGNPTDVKFSLKNATDGQDVYKRQYCTELEEIEFPPSLKYLGQNAFYGCKNLKRVRFNDGLMVIRCV